MDIANHLGSGKRSTDSTTIPLYCDSPTHASRRITSCQSLFFQAAIALVIGYGSGPATLQAADDFALVAAANVPQATDSDDDAPNWVEPEKLKVAMESITSVNWTDQTLPAGMRSLEKTFGVPLVCDRRIDVRRRITLSVADQSLEAVVQAAAAAGDREAVVTHWGILLAPRGVADRMATVAAGLRTELAELSAGDRRRLAKETDASWPRLTQPQTLLSEIGEEYQMQIGNLDQIPHDLWDSRQLPPLDFTDRVTMILASFDLTFRWSPNGRGIEIVPLPATPAYSDTYAIGSGRREPIETLRQKIPGAQLEVSGNRISVTGSWNAHREVQRWIAGEATRTPRPASPDDKRLTLNVASASLKQITDVLARDLELTFEWSDAAMTHQTDRTPVNAQDATLAELLEQVLTPSGLKFEIDGKVVKIDGK